MTGLKYDFQFSGNSVYGHVVAMLQRYVSPDGEAVVLDLAAGAGAIGEPVQSELGLQYVGVDVDEVALDELRRRGLEGHTVDLAAPDLAERLEAVLGGRRVAAVTMLDGLEHLVDGERVLLAMRRIAAAHDAAIVISVPNVTHLDVGVKLMFGAWEYTPTGLLDRTHVRFFGEEQLTRELGRVGLHRIDRNDFSMIRSDQHFPEDHSALSARSSLGRFLRARRALAERNGEVNQFIWLLVPGPVVSHERPEPSSADAPFLTVVMRTQGRRPQEFREALLCLAGQTDQAFEVVVVGHDLDEDHRLSVEAAIDETPDLLRERIRLIDAHQGSRGTLLNIGFAEARGTYVAVLDDDDLVFAHWVESFARLVPKHGGKVLRSRASVQRAERVDVRDRAGVRAISGYELPYEPEFSFVTHLVANQTPFMTAAFPASLFRDLGERFDESLTTTEDWDFLLRAASLVGVGTLPEISAIYRRWASEESSATEHDADDWLLNMNEVHRKLDSQPVLFPAGETRRIRRLFTQAMAADSQPTIPEATVQLPAVDVESLTRVLGILESRSWRAFAPFRTLTRMLGAGPAVRPSALTNMSPEQLRAVVAELEASRSWRLSRVLRRRR